MDVSARGEIVLDTFLGGGATLMAAEQSGRIARSLELDPLYIDVCLRRWREAIDHRDSTIVAGNCPPSRIASARSGMSSQ